VEGEVLAGAAEQPARPQLEAELSLDPPVVPPTGRSRERVVARSADGVTPWPSGLAVQASLEEKLILAAGAGQLLEAPVSADLVLYHPRLTLEEAAGALPGAAGAVEFVVSPSPRAAQVLLDVGYENIRLFPCPEEVEREPVVGPPGGTVETPEGVELTVPEGALAVRVPVSAELLDAAELAALPEVTGFDTLAAVRIDLQGQTLGRSATLSLPAPAGTAAPTPGDPRLVLAERIDAPADGRGAFPRLAARASLQGSGDAARVVASPEQAGALPLDGILREGLYLVLQARQPMGFATGFVRAANGAALEAARVTADGLGTADVTPAGGRYSAPVPAGAGPTVRALHPVLDETGTASIPSLDPGQVVSLDLTVVSVPPTVLSVSPVDGAVDQPVGTEVTVLFSEDLSPGTVSGATLILELADAEGQPTGLRVKGSVALAADGARVVFTPARPLLPGRTFLARFTGGVADSGGAFYEGPPLAWSFSTSTVFVPGGQVHPERFHVRVPVDGVAEIYGDPGAVPGVPLGEIPWAVTPEIEGPAADPVRDTFQVKPDGSFTGTVGHPPDFAVTLESRVWVRVFDPSGALAAEFRVGPFTTPDGRGFVAPAGEAVSFRSAEGIEVDVPAAAFDRATLVTVRRLDPASLGLATPAGLQLGAYIDLDFEGRANETLRLAVPAPAAAPAGAQAFVGRPVSLPWGRRLQVIGVGGVEMRPDGPYLSNDPSLQPEILRPASGATVAARSGPSGATELTLAPKELPEGFRRSLMMEFVLRGGAAWFYEWGASWTMMAGLVQPFGLAQGIAHEAIYNKIGDLWVYVPEPHDWGGGFVLPVLSESPLEIVRRDTATGWILAEQPYDPLPAGTDIVDVGFLPGGTPAPPLLIGARPFRLVRFQAPGPDESQTLALEIEARGAPGGQVEVSSTPGFGLAAGTRLELFDLTPALRLDPEADPEAEAEPPVAGPALSVCDEDAPWSLPAMAGG
ncbi:MAG TPA: Ig-like domain-containing protein, partial [Thermoanaerobaculia bacterium]|nr:Ig-like domain-containing protein [Thermoanaerobaculia bacterium]